MIHSGETTTDNPLVAARVRQNTVSAAIAAALLLYYSYSGGGYEIPEGDGTFEWGATIFIHTLKYGGFAMLAAALASATGLRHALLFDGVSSMLIGAAFCASGAMMMIDGGSGALYLIFGVMFLVAGKRNAAEWVALAPAKRRTSLVDAGFHTGPNGGGDHAP